MYLEKFGKITILPGKFKSKFPYCRSIFIDDKIKAIIDPGSDKAIYLDLLRKNKIKYVFNTHYHYDHIHYNYLFYRSKIYINKIEAECFMNRSNILKRVGIYQALGQKAIDDWLHYTTQITAPKTPYSPSRNHAWYLSTCRLDGTYEYGKLWQCGETEFEFIHTPGHSAGFCCVYFPGENLIYTGDIDLTPFGPWYGGTDSDIDAFIKYSRDIANLEIKNYATGHEMGSFSHAQFEKKLDQYLQIISMRDHAILKTLETSEPQTLDSLTNLGLIYGGPKYLVDPWVYAWEKVTILKHLDRLEQNKRVLRNNTYYEIR
ncbi:MAG TPA: MBL fold metallo-hydrolase [Candidatus Deferrimicrobium sp.]|nr:MBL fold metallo-hydrolase [Candidatus Deferrimicrobium sp.]